jgi:hypothetical protein
MKNHRTAMAAKAAIALTSMFVVGGLLLSTAEPAQAAAKAPTGRWCYKLPDGGADCSFDTLAQCKASRPLTSPCYRARRGRS